MGYGEKRKFTDFSPRPFSVINRIPTKTSFTDFGPRLFSAINENQNQTLFTDFGLEPFSVNVFKVGA
jgi:hypothetical protein